MGEGGDAPSARCEEFAGNITSKLYLQKVSVTALGLCNDAARKNNSSLAGR
jgi:hypothetical protein